MRPPTVRLRIPCGQQGTEFGGGTANERPSIQNVKHGIPGPAVSQAVPRVLAVIATPGCVEVLVIRFARHMITENVHVFWAELQRGESITDAAVAAGSYRKQGARGSTGDGVDYAGMDSDGLSIN